ncbi:L,D-transpeptidase family protein [Streptomyces sp. Vc74B-19]|uniref:L,D-transpeptidase family protein n=1 Tax=unclassified Streptomyces TaxID=2593676 RepID=UPI001BFC9BDA|nr:MULTISPECIES: L,D-transpeptidase family protein [unclassified Streptomyces]MBT3167370.1 L,D-transpeptidase family protein [Streptomyces sp. Vc74B-19]MCO4696055.1 L,D-transpeptidase family protein [Streptomyces sp. RO-S4]
MIKHASRGVPLVTVSLLLTGCAAAGAPAPSHATAAAAPQAPAPVVVGDQAVPEPKELPGLGPRTRAQVPEDAGQAVVVTGRGRNSSESTVVLYERGAGGWEPVSRWPAHNALKGWTDDHRLGDLRSPVGVFTLSDAGGLLPDPGTRMPYDRSDGFSLSGTGFRGESLAGSFDYVVAIDYNRRPGTSPLDWTRPLGAERGGGIWLHVDHDGPTQGCVSIAREHMRALLRELDPDRRPVVVMGDAASLAR